MTYRHSNRRVIGVLMAVLGITIVVEWIVVPLIRGNIPAVWSVLERLFGSPILGLGDFELTLALAFRALLVLGLIWVVTQVSTRVLRRGVLDKTSLEEGSKYAIQRMGAYLVFAIGTIAALQTLGLDLSTFAVFAGALGIGIGLGFQSMAKNFASGLLLLLEQPIRVGDRIEVAGIQGDIVNIGSRGTWVRTNENLVMIIPNSEFVDGTVTNLTVNDRIVRIPVPLGVSYGSDPGHVRSVLLEVAREHTAVLQDPAPEVIFTGFGDSSLDFELRVHTSRRVTRPRLIRSEIYFATFAAFKREGIEIPFPQRDIHVRSTAASAQLRVLVGGEDHARVPPPATSSETRKPDAAKPIEPASGQ